jgi:hypothetical protein
MLDPDQTIVLVGVAQAGPIVPGPDEAPDWTCITLHGVRSSGHLQLKSLFRAEFDTGATPAALFIYHGLTFSYTNGSQGAVSGANPATGAFFGIDDHKIPLFTGLYPAYSVVMVIKRDGNEPNLSIDSHHH